MSKTAHKPELLPEHIRHFESEGLSLDDLIQYSSHQLPRSVTGQEAYDLGYRAVDEDGTPIEAPEFPPGILMPAGPASYQFRPESPVFKREKGKIKLVKYVTVAGQTAEVWYSNGDPNVARFITEGFKDAIAYCKMGLPTASIIGVNCTKAIAEGCNQIPLFDRDALTNPSVAMALVKLAEKTGAGKVLLPPEIPGEPKAGGVEVLKAGIKLSMDDAISLADFFRQLPQQWEISGEARSGRKKRLGQMAKFWLRSAPRHLSEAECKKCRDEMVKAKIITERCAKAALDIALRDLRKQEKHRQNGQSATDNESKPNIDIYQGRIDDAANRLLSLLSETSSDREKIYVSGRGANAQLVRIARAVPDTRKRHISVGKEVDELSPLDLGALKHEANRRYKFTKWTLRKGKEETWWDDRPTDCSQALAEHIIKAAGWPKLPKISGICYTPTPTRTGEVIDKPGYHPGSGLLLQFDPTEFPEQKVKPTKEDALSALAVLKDLLKEFPFRLNEGETSGHNASLSAGLSMLLTAIWRKTFALAPLHAVSATVAGTGKGCLISLASILLTGRNDIGVVPFSADGEEVRKKLTGILSTGCPIVNLDNVTARLGGDSLEAVLTAPTFKDRLLQTSKMVEVSTQALFTACGNNLGFTSDMPRRVILSELDPQVEKPEERQFEREIEQYTLDNRGMLVDALLMIPRAYILAGLPDKPKRLVTFGEWSDIIRGALIWLGEADPVKTQSEVANRDESKNQLEALLTCWYDDFGEDAFTTKGLLKRINEAILTETPQDLRESLLDICLDRKTGQLSSRLLSYYLRRNRGRVVSHLRFEQAGKDRKGYVEWKVTRSKNRTYYTESKNPKTQFAQKCGETSSASSAPIGEKYTQQGNEPAEDKNTSSAPIDKNAEDAHLSSAHKNPIPVMDTGKPAEDAEDTLEHFREKQNEKSRATENDDSDSCSTPDLGSEDPEIEEHQQSIFDGDGIVSGAICIYQEGRVEVLEVQSETNVLVMPLEGVWQGQRKNVGRAYLTPVLEDWDGELD